MKAISCALLCVLVGFSAIGCQSARPPKRWTFEGERTPLQGSQHAAHRTDAERRAREWFRILAEEGLLGENAETIAVEQASLATSNEGEDDNMQTTVTWLTWKGSESVHGRELGLDESGGVWGYSDSILAEALRTQRRQRLEEEWPIAKPATETVTARDDPFASASGDPFATPSGDPFAMPSPEWRAYDEAVRKRDAAHAPPLLAKDELCRRACSLLRKLEPLRWSGFEGSIRVSREYETATFVLRGKTNGIPSDAFWVYMGLDAVQGQLTSYLQREVRGPFPTARAVSFSEEQGRDIVRKRLDDVYRTDVVSADIRHRATYIDFERDTSTDDGRRFLDRPAIVHAYRAHTDGSMWDDVLVNAQTGEIFDWSHIMLIAGPEMWAKMEEDESDGGCDCADIAD